MFQIPGLDEAMKALEGLDGELGTVRFDPDDPESIEAAIQQAEQMIDDKLADYAGNSIVGPMIEQLKSAFRQGIVEKASAARLGEDDEQ